MGVQAWEYVSYGHACPKTYDLRAGSFKSPSLVIFIWGRQNSVRQYEWGLEIGIEGEVLERLGEVWMNES